VKRVLVSALTTPDNELAKKKGRNEKLTQVESERYFCTPYVAVIAEELRETIPGSDVRPIRQITEAEGSVVTKLSLLMYFLAGASLLASALGVTSTMTSAVIERRKEIGLLKAIGAGDQGVVALLLVEAAIIGLLGGVVGYALGSGMALLVGKSAFGVAATARGVLLPVVVVIAVVTTVAGSAWPVRRALGIAPATVLHEE
jgi:putative ABC transport system permease protein